MTLACPAVRCRAAAGLSPADERDVFHCFGDVFGEYRERYGADYQQDACDQPAGQWFVEDGDADDDRHHGSSEPMTAVGVEPMSLMALTSVMSEMTVETRANSRMLMPVPNVMAGVNESRERARSRKKAAQNSME